MRRKWSWSTLTCHIKRSARYQTFDAVAEYGHTSVGWFFGLKLHLVINDRGELMAFKSKGEINLFSADLAAYTIKPLKLG